MDSASPVRERTRYGVPAPGVPVPHIRLSATRRASARGERRPISRIGGNGSRPLERARHWRDRNRVCIHAPRAVPTCSACWFAQSRTLGPTSWNGTRRPGAGGKQLFPETRNRATAPSRGPGTAGAKTTSGRDSQRTPRIMWLRGRVKGAVWCSRSFAAGENVAPVRRRCSSTGFRTIDREPRRWARRDVELLMAMSAFHSPARVRKMRVKRRSPDTMNL